MRVDTQTQVETFNENLRQTRFIATPTQKRVGGSDVRLSEVSSAAARLGDDHRLRAHRVR
jgi:hypothetical protein